MHQDLFLRRSLPGRGILRGERLQTGMQKRLQLPLRPGQHCVRIIKELLMLFFGINLTLGLFQICADGPLGSTRECEEGCNFNNDCPIEQVTNHHHHRQDCRKNAKKCRDERRKQGRVGVTGMLCLGDAYAAKTDSAFNPTDLTTIAFIVTPFIVFILNCY